MVRLPWLDFIVVCHCIGLGRVVWGCFCGGGLEMFVQVMVVCCSYRCVVSHVMVAFAVVTSFDDC